MCVCVRVCVCVCNKHLLLLLSGEIIHALWCGLCHPCVVTRVFLCLSLWCTACQNALLSFMDLCAVSNISMLIFDSAIHGFYIHGRTPHGFADVDMYTMLVNLKKVGCKRKGMEGKGWM